MILPDPDAGFADVGFVSAAGSAVYFLVTGETGFKAGDTFVFTSAGVFPEWNGEYVISSVAYDGSVSTLTTTSIGTALVIGD